MVYVKPRHGQALPDPTPMHVGILGDRLLRLMRQVVAEQERDGLRTVHFRLLSCVPPSGTTVTDLSAQLWMTKQAVGQFVAQLQSTGHLDTAPDQADRRRRIVRRTAVGDRTVTAVNESIAALESQWAELVGPERYREFRRVLEQIVLR